jgi:hypothetical protein
MLSYLVQDYAVSNTLGAIAAVLAACVLSFITEQFFHAPYQVRGDRETERQR